jgi:UDP:flavonoid glycosyltransferase YjiC (YdhE family)
MSRFLFVSPALTGHVNAPLAVGRVLAEQGHEVAWAGSETYLRPLVGPDVTVYPTGLRLYRPQAQRGLSAIRTLWEKFVVPFNRFILPSVEKAVQAFGPDVVAVDQHAVAGAVVAHRSGVRWASLAPQSMELSRPFADRLPRVEAWIQSQLDRVWADAGLPAQEAFDTRFSPYLLVAFTLPALAGTDFPSHYRLVGPAMAPRRSDPEFDFSALDPDRRRVLVTIGTMANEVAADFHQRCADALGGMAGVQGIVVAPPESVRAPAGVLVVPAVPMLDVLPRVDAVVGHGGLNTTGEALAHGLPLVVAPIRNDQPIIADQVAAAGAGIRVSFTRASALQLRTAIGSVLDGADYRDAARRVREDYAAAGGVGAAADHLVRLAKSAVGPN